MPLCGRLHCPHASADWFLGLIGPAAAFIFATVFCAHAVLGLRKLTIGERIASILLLLFDTVATVYIVRVILDTKVFGEA